MKDQFSQIAKRARRFIVEDGTTELLLGGMLFLGGIMQTIAWFTQSTLIPLAVFIAGPFILGALVVYLKWKYVYPRAGYVEYKATAPKRIWSTLLLAIILAYLSVSFIVNLPARLDPNHALAWYAPMLAAFLSLGFAYLSVGFKIVRLGWVSLISLLTGALLSPLVLGGEVTEVTTAHSGMGNMVLYFLVMGLAVLVSGGLGFRNFLRCTPLPAESSDEQ